MTQSMSRVAHCTDNGPMEGFWGIMKREMYYGKKYKTKHLPVTHYRISIMAEELYDYFSDTSQLVLMFTKAGMQTITDKYQAVIHACCRAYSEVIMHYFDISNR